MKEVDKTGLPGKFKAWIYQHGILLPLLLYEFQISTMSDLERSQPLPEEMAWATGELEQHRPLRKHLQTEAPAEIH